MHAHLTIQLASKIRLKLLVVNPVKLHLTALIYYITINFIYLCFNAFKVKGTILKVLENLVRTGVEKRYFLSSCEDFEEDTCTVVPGKILHNFFSFFIFLNHCIVLQTTHNLFLNLLFVVQTNLN